jgi:hypothetical protein
LASVNLADGDYPGMSCYIYCLYATEDGEPRYVGRASDRVSYRLRQHVTAALEMEPGPLYDWMRNVYRGEHDVAVYTLQEGIAPKDLPMFEQYWINQFSNLLNIAGNESGRADSPVAKQIKEAIREQLRLAKRRPQVT